MVRLSKSKYCLLWQCPKMLWLKQYKPEAETVDADLQRRFDAGNEVGDLAMGYFGPYTEVTVRKEDGRLDLCEMIRRTKEEMAKGTQVICEASFAKDGLYCAVDILKKEQDGWALYEVKSSTEADKAVYAADVAFQKHVLELCGVNVTGTYIICIDNQYVLGDELDIHRLFKITDISAGVAAESMNIAQNLAIAETVMSDDVNEPAVDISVRCRDPYKCNFWKYCTRALPEESVFDLYLMKFKKQIDYYRRGMVSYEDVINDPGITNKTQLRQMEYALSDKGTYIDSESISEFLSQLSYPLYFLDFETMQPVVPLYKGTKPNEQITFQYSLHYIEHEGGELKHKEFLAVSGEDPRRAIAESLCRDIPMNVCTTAYNRSFECNRLRELAKWFPDLAAHLLNISDNIVDLLVPFQKGYYYNRAMGGSFSIKSVLPAIFPDDPELDYHNLESVQNGSDAMSLFPMIKDMPPEDQEKARRDLLKYCELDTFAMVKVWEELVRVSSR